MVYYQSIDAILHVLTINLNISHILLINTIKVKWHFKFQVNKDIDLQLTLLIGIDYKKNIKIFATGITNWYLLND